MWRLIGILFAVGSACFAVASFISQWGSVANAGIGVTFFVGSVFFTSAAFLQLRASHTRSDRVASAIQFVGTLFFNISTFLAMNTALDAEQDDLRVWTPDVFGSICFLASGYLAYVEVCGGYACWRSRSLGWTIAALNLLGCIAFGISAVAAYVVPATGSVLDLAAANGFTALGGLCFLVGAVLLLPEAAGAETA